jgi:hypothetical protein
MWISVRLFPWGFLVSSSHLRATVDQFSASEPVIMDDARVLTGLAGQPDPGAGREGPPTIHSYSPHHGLLGARRNGRPWWKWPSGPQISHVPSWLLPAGDRAPYATALARVLIGWVWILSTWSPPTRHNASAAQEPSRLTARKWAVQRTAR